MSNTKLPNLIIIGVHKSATTSLFMYLKEHPNVFGASKKEIHYFTPIRYGRGVQPIEEYAKYFQGWNKEKYALEASPSYFYGQESIIVEMKKHLGDHKVILMLREPTARFISFYKHLKSKLLISESETFASFIEKSKEYVGKPIIESNPYSRAIQEGFYIDYILPWLEAYGKDLKIVFFEDLKNTKTLMLELANWLSIDADFYENMDFTVENKTVYAKNKFLHKVALILNDIFESFFRRNSKMKKLLRSVYFSFNTSKVDETISENEISILKSIYDKPNQQLKVALEMNGIKTPY